MVEGNSDIIIQPIIKYEPWDFEESRQTDGISVAPFISVVLTCRERKAFIKRAVNSIFQQKLPHELFEVIVVKSFLDDDIDKYLKSKDILILQDTHHELAHKIASGVAKARGQIISLLEDDDEFMPAKLDTIYKLFSNNKNLTFVRDRIEAIDEQGETISFSAHSHSQAIDSFVAETPLDFHKDITKFIKCGAGAYVSAMSIRRETLNQYIEKLEALPGGADAFLFTAAVAAGGAVAYESKVLTRYRVHNFHSVPNTAKTLDQRETIQTFVYRQRMYAEAANTLLAISKGTVAWEYASFFFGCNVIRLHLLDSRPRLPPPFAIKNLLSQRRILFRSLLALRLLLVVLLKILFPNTISNIYTNLSIANLRSNNISPKYNIKTRFRLLK